MRMLPICSEFHCLGDAGCFGLLTVSSRRDTEILSYMGTGMGRPKAHPGVGFVVGVAQSEVSRLLRGEHAICFRRKARSKFSVPFQGRINNGIQPLPKSSVGGHCDIGRQLGTVTGSRR